MNNRNNREGGFYSAKVRLFLNEYGGENLSKKVLHGSRFMRPILDLHYDKIRRTCI